MNKRNIKEEELVLEDLPIQIGEQAKDFVLSDFTLNDVKLSDFENKYKIISCFPSIDTGICDIQTKTLIEKIKNKKDAVLLNVSMDLPFAFKRWCNDESYDNIYLLSDYKTHQFAKDYGIHIKYFNLCYRSIFILDKDNKIVYKQLSKKIGQALEFNEILEFIEKIN